MSHTPDEAQLTAYLLGELTPEEAAQVEAQLAVSAALREELAELRQTVSSLKAALAAQTPTAVPPIDRDRLHMLLQSAVVAPEVERAHLPVRLAAPLTDKNVCAPGQHAIAPGRSRGWLVAATVLVVGGLIGLSQWETRHGTTRDGLARSGLRRAEQEGLLARNHGAVATNGLGGIPLSDVEHLKLQVETSLSLTKARGATTQPVDTLAAIAQSTPAGTTTYTTQAPRASVRLRSHTVRNVSPATVNAPERVVDYSESVDGLAATDFGTTALGLERRFVTASDAKGLMPGQSVDRYFFQSPPTRGLQGLEKQQSSFGRQAVARREFGLDLYGDVPESARGEGFKDNYARFGFETARVDGRGGVPLGFRFKTPQSSARGLQRDEGLTELTSESLILTDDAGLVFDEKLSRLGDRMSLFDVDGEAQLNRDKDDLLMLMVTPRIIVQEEAESLAELESMPEAKQVAQLPALTVANYENGFAQLGAAVKGWGEFTQHWGVQRDESLARGTEAGQSARPAVKELEDLSQVVADQTRVLQELREKTPANAEKPLAEVDAAAAKEAQLALVRVSRELNRQQQVWYYREGYVRQLEATIAAAEQYAHIPENDFVTPEAQPLSTFGIDVDTASYSNVRRFVESGQLPPPDAVRIEELVNSFQYDGPKVEGEHPLAVAAEVSACPWQPQHQLLRVALKGKSIDLQQRPPARLVFLVDTSGSMSDENKLPLVKQSLRILVEQMREQDRLSIVTYSDNAGLLLDSTGGDKREAILAAIEGLNADGSTNGEAGLKLAYEVAVKQFGEGATNRVMLCTDGDFNVGESADSELVKLIEKERQTGVFLNIFGFGSGNLKDAKLEAIADKGNGQYIYIDGIKEARKTLLNELTGTLYTIAKDVKLQIEFNPNLVGSYRLVGYENRAMAAKDFSNDKVDSGDMGAGHSVVALYEIVPPGAPQPAAPQPQVEPLKYKRAGSVSARSEAEVAAAPARTLTPSLSPEGRGEPEGAAEVAQPAAEAPVPVVEKPADPLATELCTIRVRYKQPTSNESTKIETAVHHPMLLLGGNAPTSRDHVWATAVAQFGLLTRHSTFVGTGNYSQVLELAQSAIGDDPTGQRREFVTLVRQTQSLSFERERQLAEISRRAEQHRRVVNEIKTIEQAPDLMTKASCSGKYKTLLRRIEVPDDQPTYGEFKDFGRWNGAEYKVHKNLPSGYWVYAAPHWYIWGESTEQAAVDAAK